MEDLVLSVKISTPLTIHGVEAKIAARAGNVATVDVIYEWVSFAKFLLDHVAAMADSAQA